MGKKGNTLESLSGDQYLSPLRRDVVMSPGPGETDGSPTAILWDAVTESFHRLGWREMETVRRLRTPVRFQDLADSLRNETTIGATDEELQSFIQELGNKGLLQSSRFRDPKALLQERERRTAQPFGKLIRRYLFFRVPLFRPDAFLRDTLWVPRVLGSTAFRILYGLAAVAALYLFIPRSGTFWRDAESLMAWRGAVLLTIALGIVKACHELSHAYAARVRGVRVRVMGVAFMIFAPIPYTDVTESWRLDRRSRLAISMAGIRTELVIAACSLLGWTLFPPGAARDVCLLLSSASILSTLTTNLNPGMRFDGYYILSDLIRVDNLQARGFAHGRRVYRQALLGLEVPEGEPTLSRSRRAALVLYAAYACVYRLGLYFGIALVVYRFFPKAIGIALFMVEVMALLVQPIWREIRDVAALMRKRKRPTVRTVLAGITVLAVLAWLAAPLPRRLVLDAIVVPDAETQVFIPDSGILRVNTLQRGAMVRQGDVLVQVENDELDFAIARTALERDYADAVVEYARSDAGGRTRIRDRFIEADRLVREEARLHIGKAMNTIRADRDGRVIEVERTLVPGSHVAARTLAGRIVPVDARVLVAAYVREEYANDVRPGDSGVFIPDSDPAARIPVRITRVQSNASTRLEEPALAVPRGGRLAAVVHDDGSVVPETTVYRVEAEAEWPPEGADRLWQRGVVHAGTEPRSYMYEALVHLYRVVLRESGI